MRNLKKIIIICIVALIGVGIVLFMQNGNSGESDLETLVYYGDQQASVVVDVAIQKGEMVLYLGKVKMLESNPNLLQLVETINESNEGVCIELNKQKFIVGVDQESLECQISIDNEEVEVSDISSIQLEKDDGVTLYFNEK